MAKRYTATEKWHDPWFSGLKPTNKLFWIYLLDNCDHAGIWQVNWPLAKFHLGDFEYDKAVFKGRIIEVSEERWFIPKFIDFQYGELNPENRMHMSVIKILKKEGLYKDHTRTFQGPKYMDKDMDKDILRDESVREGVETAPTELSASMEALKNKWNSALPNKVATLNSNRIELLIARLQEPLFVSEFDKILQKIQDSDFLSGRVKSNDQEHKKFKATFDWVIQNDVNYVRILEGKYDNDKKKVVCEV